MKKFEGIIPTELIASIKDNRCILFVGSGLSSKVTRSNGKNLPSWKNFLQELLDYLVTKRLNFTSNEKDIREMIGKGNLLMCAQELQEALTPHDFNAFLKDVFNDRGVKPHRTHLLLPRIPFRSVLTSNYDNLIEGAYALANQGRTPIKFTHDDLLHISSPLRTDDFYIFKVHGDIDRPKTIILGSRDYHKLFFRSPEFRHFLETLFSVYTILFIGYGAADPDMENVLDKLSGLFERSIDKHYILMPEGTFNLTERKRLLLDKRIEVIEYRADPSFTQVDAFLEELVEKTENQNIQVEKEKTFDVFVSRSSKDDELADRLIDIVRNRGYKVWDFKKDIGPGDVWQDALANALNESRFMIFLISENYSGKSRWLEKELELGLLKQVEGKIKVLPIVIEGTPMKDIPPVLFDIMYLKLRRGFNEDDLTPLFKAMAQTQM